MKFTKYKSPKGDMFITYGEGEIPESINCFKEEDNISIENDNVYLPIINVSMLIQTLFSNSKNRDKILASYGINSWYDIHTSYFQIKMKHSNLSKKVRDMVVEKYLEIVEQI